MKTDPCSEQPPERDRKSLRLPGFDYTQPGAYFVTIVTHHRVHIFGSIGDGLIHLSPCGHIAREESLRSSRLRNEADTPEDEFIIMPNHIHGIIHILETVGARRRRAPTPEMFGHPVAGSLATLVRAFKSATTYCINRLWGTTGTPVWQRGYYEHVIRSEEALTRLRRYIQENPSRWDLLHVI